MNSLFINSLYIFECKNEVAKKVEFKKGINIITADKFKGNNVGKSSIVKSIYHTLGADNIFSDMWKKDSKVYIINICINEERYYIYRRESLFRIFSENFERLFTTDNRQVLSEFLYSIYKFKIMLPDRKEEKLEIAPPVYSYLMNYIDQDKMDGAKFGSFNYLTQYADYKEKVIYTHLGVYDECYFDASKKIEILKNDISNKKKEKNILKNMLTRIDIYLSGLDAPDDIKILNIELEETKKEYSDIIIKLQKVKNNLIEIRNQKIDLELNIKGIEKSKKEEEKKWTKQVDKDGYLNADLKTKIIKSNELEELIIMKDEFEELVLECNRNILKKEEEYKLLLEKLNKYEEKLKINDLQVSNILKHKGYLKAKNDILTDLSELDKYIEQREENLKNCNSIIKTYDARKKQINKEYESLMIESKEYFELKEIEDKKFKKVGTYFKADGSNLPIGTVIWYFNLLKLKHKFNKEALKFPLVLDSPNNAEIDEAKIKSLFKYIFKNNVEDTQLIVSTLAFDENDYNDVAIKNIVKLENEKYNLLNHDDYEENRHILELILNN